MERRVKGLVLLHLQILRWSKFKIPLVYLLKYLANLLYAKISVQEDVFYLRKQIGH